MSCETSWQSPAFYPSYPAGTQYNLPSVVTNSLLKPGFFFQLALLALLAVFFSGTRLHAQTGLITGTVVDPSGAGAP